MLCTRGAYWYDFSAHIIGLSIKSFDDTTTSVFFCASLPSNKGSVLSRVFMNNSSSRSSTFDCMEGIEPSYA